MSKINKKRLSMIIALALMVQPVTVSNSVRAEADVTGGETQTTESINGETSTDEIMTGETSTDENVTGEISTDENVTGETSTGNQETESETESTTEEETETTTAVETTTVDYVIIDDLYKVRNEELIEFLGDKEDESFTVINLPEEIRKIDAGIFTDFKYVTTFTTGPNSKLEEIGNEVFKGCVALETVALPGRLKVIGANAFAGCTVMENVILPQTLTTIGLDAFDGCLAMTEISIPKDVTSAVEILGKNSNVTKVTFEAGIKKIPDQVIKNCKSVTSVVLPAGIAAIGSMAFFDCDGLTEVTIPNTVTKIENSAFNACTNLSTVKAYSGIKTIEKKAFKNCKALTSFTMYKTITTMGEDVFLNDNNLVLKVYSNSFGKKYALDNKIKWEYTESEVKRQLASTAIHNTLMSKVSKKYGLKMLSDYVPQGLCVVGKYVYVSMYHKNKSKKSIILMYDKSKKTFVKYFKIPNIDHVGSLTNVEGRLVVSLNSISAADTLAVMDYKKTISIKNKKTIKYSYKVKLPGHADFAGYDGKVFWAGRSANDNYCTMQGYKVKVKKKQLKFTKKYSFSVPPNCQGLVVEKAKTSSRRYFLFSQSYGLIADAYLISYSTNVNKSKTLGEPKSKKKVPAMLEGIAKTSAGYLYMVFESAAGLYCTDPTHTTEIQEKDIFRMKYSDVASLSE